MADDENKQDPEAENPQKTTPPAQEGDGQGKKDEDLPEKFKGKTASDIAKSYLELEKKLGGTSEEVSKARKQIETIGRVLEHNPKLKQAFLDEVDVISGKPPADPKDDKKEDKKPAGQDDNRKATEDLIVGRFEDKYGINRIEGEKRKDLYNRIGTELAEMLDPSGEKPVNQIIAEIPLNRLDKYLEKAYKAATVDDQVERARARAYLDARQNDEASWGSIPSSGGKGKDVELTPKEREAARRLNVSEENYKKQKLAMQKGA